MTGEQECADERAPEFVDERKCNRWVTKYQRGGRYSHTMLNGGVLNVPFADLPKLYAALASDLNTHQSCRFYLCEVHTNVFPMYYDLDLKKEVTESHPVIWQNIKKVMRENIRRFFPEDAADKNTNMFDAIVCTIQDELTGIHVVFPNVLVDKESAEAIRYSLVSQLFHEARELADWEAVVDKEVYAVGLRMPGSKKLVNCTHCKRGTELPPNGVCPGLCNKNHKQCVNRRYVFSEYLSDNTDEKTSQYAATISASWVLLLKACSLRRPDGAEKTPGFHIFPGCPRPTANTRKRNYANMIDASKHRGIYEMVQDEIRRCSAKYTQLDVEKIVYSTVKRKSASVFVSGLNSTYCFNKRGEHNSKRVFFVITPAKIEIRCSCKCSEIPAHSNKKCSEYRSTAVHTPERLKAALFDNKSSGLQNEDNFYFQDPSAAVQKSMSNGPTMYQRMMQGSKPTGGKPNGDKPTVGARRSTFTSTSKTSPPFTSRVSITEPASGRISHTTSGGTSASATPFGLRTPSCHSLSSTLTFDDLVEMEETLKHIAASKKRRC